ncbi:LON peptidase substrate-binding domain-containing protein [Martelella lutilitoris]|uniref:LON peptidase substrate-binding domain-containing protein n=1 Tax=Martelella lutilitoris TaxID=2583532 RepID=A0A7T7KMF8_9HYPH|nr:LON peptidase substrate-binding domain-containing protein [Martelella lutilitoris]QQM30904.1 LON peptidase substrate-binding domain-containing protein [Martelella lutilitoris]
MQVGNARYLTRKDLPEVVPVFPLTGGLLLPQGQLPLNIFEPRYLAMVDQAISGNRLIAMVQPAHHDETLSVNDATPLSNIGCVGRVTSFAETGDGRYLVALTGICRVRLIEEVRTAKPFRSFEIAPFMGDLNLEAQEESVDRAALLGAFRDYLEAEGLETEWAHIEQAGNLTLVNSLSMMAPFGPAEKQALLEAPDLKTRAELFVAIIEFALAGDPGDKLQ